MAPKNKKKAVKRRAPFAGTRYYVGCRELDRYITDPATANGLLGSFDSADARARESVAKDGKARYIVQVVAKVSRINPPITVERL
jgi:hypothetical protein